MTKKHSPTSPPTTHYDTSGIQVLSGVEAVRKRPGMYFGECDARGIEQMVFDLVSNSIDQFLANKATSVDVLISDNAVVIKDDGPGLPFEETLNEGTSHIEAILTRLHSSASWDNHAPHVHLRLTGVGMAPINFVSSEFHIQSWRGNKLWEYTFHRGVAQHEPRVIKNGSDPLMEKGTTITLKPDSEIFSDTTPRHGVLRNLLFECVHLFPNLRIKLNDERFVSKNGLVDFLYSRLENQDSHDQLLKQPFHYHQTIENLDIQVAAAGRNRTEHLKICSWVNGVRTSEHGSHVDGIKSTLSELSWTPEVLLVHVIAQEPRFAGPTKDRLNAPEIESIVKTHLADPIAQYVNYLNNT